MQAYSLDVRERIINRYEQGLDTITSRDARGYLMLVFRLNVPD